MVIVRDRVTALRRLVSTIEGRCKVVLLDNDSSYPPLLDYLRESEAKGHEVVRLGRNLGPGSPWISGATAKCNGPFIVTDPDMYPDDNCPPDFVDALLEAGAALWSRGVVKIGLSLRIDDLPQNPVANQVRQWEQQFWRECIGRGRRGAPWYSVPVDTTFALYRAGAPFVRAPAARIGAPYTMCCPSWYEDPEHRSEEERYYIEHASSASTWSVAQKTGRYP